VALATGDPALYAELAGVLQERHIPSVSVLPGERMPDRVVAVLTSEAEAPRISHPHVIAVPPDGERTGVWAEVVSALSSSDPTDELIVGIDPGPRPGYSILEGPTCIGEGVLSSPEEVGRLGSHLRRRFPSRRLRFRVGSGDPLHRDRIVNALLPIRRPIEVVDEQRTTPRGARRLRDPTAARAIARASGRTIRGPAHLTVTPGEIADLQRVSRLDSNGHFTIPRRVAEGVLRGELTLLEALADGERRYSRSGRGALPASEPS
jgi:hypothetical protein